LSEPIDYVKGATPNVKKDFEDIILQPGSYGDTDFVIDDFDLKHSWRKLF